METNNNRTQWFDGLLYSMTMDNIAGKAFAGPISRMVKDGTRAIDIGCGVGSMVEALAVKCAYVAGVDISSRMVDFARRRLVKQSVVNAEIFHCSAVGLSMRSGNGYDYAVMTQFLHEIPFDDRIKVIKEVKSIAREIIIADFITPFPDTITGRCIRLVEKSAGRDHNACFIDWQSRGGLDGFINECGLKTVEEKPYTTGVGKIVRTVPAFTS